MLFSSGKSIFICNMKKLIWLMVVTAGTLNTCVYSQTESDGLRMKKKNFCGGLVYNYSYWTKYWEGTYFRDAKNMGTVSTTAIATMDNYGLSDRLNIIFSLPYVQTHATAGTFKGMHGLQDLNVFAKWLALEKSFGHQTFSLYTVLGVSSPTNDYIADYLPLSIGLKSRTASFRIIADHSIGNWFVTASADYIYRDNIKIDRNSYYTDKMIYSNEVYMPNVFTSNFRLGYRKNDFVIEGVYEIWNTLGGFDIRKNDMPFPSNNMDMNRAGLNLKVPFHKLGSLALVANSFYTIKGRNVGQSFSNMLGVFYVFDFNHKNKTEDKPQEKPLEPAK
jgi:hypothetical protein